MKNFIIYLLLFVGVAGAFSQNLEEVIKKESLKTWGLITGISDINFSGFISEEIHEGDGVVALKNEASDSLLGYAFITSALGRYEQFDYFVLYDIDLVVKAVKVWKYRSSHGGAISGKRWLKQFIGYKGGQLKYGKDIQALSGATISGNSIVDDIQRVQKIVLNLQEKDLL